MTDGWPKYVVMPARLEPNAQLVDSCGNRFYVDPTEAVWIPDAWPQVCGCEDPTVYMPLFVEFLEAVITAKNDETHALWHRIDEDPATALVAALCDAYEWIDHGTSIRTPWITDLGRQTLVAMRRLLESE